MTEPLASSIENREGQNGHHGGSERGGSERSANGYHGQNGHSADMMPRSEAGKAVSEEIYWRDYYEHPDFCYEWNNGILEEKPMADVRNADIYRWLLILLNAYLTVNPIARLVHLEIGFRLPLPDKTTIRKPDLFAMRNDNPVPLHDRDRNYTGIVDLAIESLSDSTKQEIERDTVHKKNEYEGIGVQEYYILDAEDRHTAFYSRTASGTYAPITPVDHDIIRSTVLPGFQFRISDLHRQPTLIEMAEDEVYSAFVLPEYQNQKARAERLAAKLRELGITEDELE